ncbi:MAG TPA: Ig-like domain-containing protein [Candidatus Dojkabacteria bacterium]|nr:Ig-like domain-containing protein [Candidatus Dojkabacteria bacterium]
MPRPKKETMTSKVEVKSNNSSVSVFAGMVVLFFGIILVIIGIVFLVLYKLPPKEDTKIAQPKIETLPVFVNTKTVTVKGTAETSKVIVYVNDKAVDENVPVRDKEFTYEYKFETEGSYKFEAAAVEGFPVRHRSLKSSDQVISVDWSAPSKDVKFVYSKTVDTKKVNVSGTTEPNSTVIMTKGNKEYTTTADKDGKFTFKNIPLDKGENSFRVVVADRAGNRTLLDNNVVIAYKPGSVDGNGTTDLPESAGNLTDAMNYVFGNKLMSTFGVIALFLFFISSAFTLLKLRKDLE